MKSVSDQKLEQLFYWGRPFSPLYSCIMANRSSMYRKGVLKQHRLDAPVISVGNLVLGGTGKTPLVHHIAKLLLLQNKKPGILSRGYRGRTPGEINVVSDGHAVLMDAEQAGDEPRLLAEKLPGVPVITGKKRAVTGRFAIEKFGVDCLILDDGFQHLAVKRDIDLVLFSSGKFLGNGRVLPGGDMREPLSALRRADAFVLSNVHKPMQEQEKDFLRLLNSLFPKTPVFTGSYVPRATLHRSHATPPDSMNLSEAAQIPVYGFCGIGRPESFHDTLVRATMNLVGFHPFADHHPYTETDLNDITMRAMSAGAQALVTTEKDMVKLRTLNHGAELPLLTLSVDFQLEKDFDRFLLDNLP